MMKHELLIILEVIKQKATFDDLAKIEAATDERRIELREARQNPCKHFECNGEIIGHTCNGCGQTYANQ